MALNFQSLVDQYYTSLYRFALSLCQNQPEASDLTQQTFYLWAKKGHQLRDSSKVKSWLFTTLYREFLGSRRHAAKFHHHEIETVTKELPNVQPTVVDKMDAATVMSAIFQLDELYRPPIVLFYLGEHSYQEIADILDVPIGTIMSRLSRGKQQLRQTLHETKDEQKIIQTSPEIWRQKNG